MILISSHQDRVFNDMNLSYSEGKMKGLLDNILGVFLTYMILLDDQNLVELEKQGKLKIWHGKGEEWSILTNPPKLTKKDLVIVVDVACGKYKKYDFALENIWGMSDEKIKEIKENLEWEGFRVKAKKYTGEKWDEDEAWEWKKLGIPVLSFIIPIEGKEDGWHRIQADNEVSIEKIKLCSQGLKRTINYLNG